MTSPHADLTRRHKDRTNKHNYLDIYHHNNPSLVPNVLNIRCKFYLSRDNMGRFKQKHILPSNWKKNIAAYQIHTSGEAAELIRFKHLQKNSKYKLSQLAHVAIQCECAISLLQSHSYLFWIQHCFNELFPPYIGLSMQNAHTPQLGLRHA